MKSVVRIIRLILVLGVLFIALVWIVLAMPLFADLRRPALEKLLSEQIGQPLYIKEATIHIIDRRLGGNLA